MKTTAQLINSLLWPDEKYQYAVVNTRPDGSFLIVYSDTKPSFHSMFQFWIINTPVKTTVMNGEETTDWKSAIVTQEQWLAEQPANEQWLAAQPPAQQIPQVGETWMTSNGQVKIVYASRTLPNDPEFQHFCGESPGGSLDIYLLEELKPFLSPSHLFAEAALKLIDEHITPSYSFHRLAGEISAGQLDAELAALGYVPAKAGA